MRPVPWISQWMLLLIGVGTVNCLSAAPPSAAIVESGPQQTSPAPSKDKVLTGFPTLEQIETLGSLLGTEAMPIDLASALRLAGVENPQLLLARQRVTEAVALRQLAAAQTLPSLHFGTSYDNHNGNLQQSSGNILKVDRGNVYVGAGAHAVAAGTVSIPGVMWNVNVSQTLYDYLVSRQIVEQRRFASRAAENEILRQVALAYTDLLRAEGNRVLALKIREEAREVVRLTAAFAKAGQGRQSDADRAISEFGRREADLQGAEGAVLTASARLAELLNLDPSTRLHTIDAWVVPTPVVPEPIPLPELLAIALMNRPELHERQAVIRQALLSLDSAKVLPFSPNVIVGFSAGMEAGGSNLVAEPIGTTPFARNQSRFGNSGNRTDFDAIAFWTLQNLGVGNTAMIREARSHLNTAHFQLLTVLDQVRAEVAEAHARVHARSAQIATSEQAVRSTADAFQEDSGRIKGLVGLPIELLDSLRLVGLARSAYLRSIVDYNQAQLDLYVALGQPPADMLARPVPKDFVPPETAEKKQPK